MKRKYLLCLSGALILASLALIFILPNLSSAPIGYLELYDVKDERVGIVHCKIWYLMWHGRKTELEFLFYKRSRVAAYGVPGSVSGQWIQAANGNVTVKDGDVCARRIYVKYIIS